MLSRENLHGYQRRAVDFIKSHERCALFLDMGLGKTVSTLTAVSDLIARGEVASVLVATKKLIALHTWTEEVKKWEHLSSLKVVPIIGTKKQRYKALEQGADIYTINVENVCWLFGQVYPDGCPFDVIILDESSLFKNGKAKRSKAMRPICDGAGRVVALTGTPASNGYMDLWGQFRLVDGGERLTHFITHYRDKYFRPLLSHGHITYKWGLRDGAKRAIEQKVSDITLSMTAKDYLELPPMVTNDIYVKLPESAMRKYRRLKKEAVAELNWAIVTAANAATLSGKLLQAANGAVYTTDDHDWELLHDAKIEWLKEIVETAVSPILIAYNYRHDRERIMEALEDYAPLDATEEGAIEKWNRGDVPVLLGHPASVGHGLNLQEGGHTIVWFGLTWNLEQYDQFNARLARQGQKESVIVHRLIARGTLDERVAMVLKAKGDVQAGLLEALKGELEE